MKRLNSFSIISGLSLLISLNAFANSFVVTQLETNYFNDFFSPGHLEDGGRANAAIEVLTKAYAQLGCKPYDLREPGRHQGTIVKVGANCPAEVAQVLTSNQRTLDLKYSKSRLRFQMDIYTFREKYRINSGVEIGLAQGNRDLVVFKFDDGTKDGPLFTLENLKLILD